MPRTKRRTAAELKQARCDHLEPISYDPRQFAHACGISVRLLYQLWHEGKGPPYVMLHARRVIPRAGAEQWLAGQQR